ncbi:putative reverse transcriptase domain-containing protein [Tanacetum coccineum]
MSDATIKALITQGVADALAGYEANRGSGNGHDGDGVVGLTQWFEKMKYVFHISNCTVAYHIKFATCTLLGNALAWWNSHVKTVGHDAAYRMPWKTLMKMLTNKYCPRSEIKKLEIEIWNLKVKGTNVKIRDFAERQAENKRKLDNNSSDNNAQQPPFKRQNVARAYTARPSEKKEYAGTLPMNPAATNNQRTLTCFENGNPRHYRSDIPKLKNQNHGNQPGNGEAHGKVYALGG